MATTPPTPRMGVTKWTSENDAFTRQQMNDSHQNIEERAARFVDLTQDDLPEIDGGTSEQYERSFHFRNIANGERGLSVSIGETASGYQWYGLPPAGTIVAWAGSSTAVPAGWLLCDGTQKSQTAFPTLYAALGNTYGSDSGGQFTLPDFRGRVIVGATAGASGANVATGLSRGSVGGTSTVTLTEAQIPAHYHGPGNSVGGSGDTPTAFAGFKYGTNSDPGGNEWWYTLSGSATTQRRQNFLEGSSTIASRYYAGRTFGVTDSGTGSGAAHNNMQPYGVANWIIKT